MLAWTSFRAAGRHPTAPGYLQSFGGGQSDTVERGSPMRALARRAAAALLFVAVSVFVGGCGGGGSGAAADLEQLANDAVFRSVPADAELTLAGVDAGCLDRDSGGREGYAIREYVIDPIEHPQWRGDVVASFEHAATGTVWVSDDGASGLAGYQRSDGSRIDVIHLVHRPEGEFLVTVRLPPGTFCG